VITIVYDKLCNSGGHTPCIYSLSKIHNDGVPCTQLYLLVSVLIPAFEVSVSLAFTIAWRITFNCLEFKRVCRVYLDTL